MSVCDHLSTVSAVPESTFSLHSTFGTAPKLRSSSHRLARKPWTLSPQSSSASRPSIIRSPLSSDVSLSLSRESYFPPLSASLDAIANMENRSKQVKVTLPPLSALTTSIDLERNRAHPSAHDRNHIQQSPVINAHDVVMRDVRRSSVQYDTDASLMHGEARWSKECTIPRELQRSSAANSPSIHTIQSLPSTSPSSSFHNELTLQPVSPRPPRSITRGIAESNRPRSNSSPHKKRMQNPPRRSSLAEASEADRILDSLLYVQDINRRLGLNVASPASPSLFRRSDATRLLHNKLLDELDNMALFSQSRAESVANHIGLGDYLAPSRAFPNPESLRDVTHDNANLHAPAVSSGQAGHSAWPPNDSTERMHPSIGRLSLEDRLPHESDHYYPPDALERDYREARAEPRTGARDAYAAHLVHADPPHRPISKAVSFEHARAHSRSYHHGHPYEPTPTEFPRFEAEARASHEQLVHHPYAHAAPPPPVYFADSRHQQQMDLLDRRRLAGKGMKRVRKRKNEHHQECLGCQAKETPEWRKGPMGPRTLCNACGLLYAKLTKRKQQEAEAAARASGKSAEDIVREREESPGAKQASLEALRAELNLANGLRNRPTSSTASSMGSSNMLNAPQLATEFSSPRFHEGMHHDAASNQPWPARHAEDVQLFAHHPPSHRTMMVSPGRSNSLSHVESLDQLAIHHRIDSGSGPSGTYTRSAPMRPYTGGDSPSSRPLAHQPVRQRSSTLQSSAAAPPRHTTSPYDRTVSPGTSSAHAYAHPAPGVQRRPHRYM